MEYWFSNYVFFSTLVSLISILWVLKRRRNSFSSKQQLPPGPKGWPIFGNIFDLGNLPHRSVAALKQEYGPVVWLSLGAVKTVVIQSAAAAEELFKNHDISFSARSTFEIAKSHDYYQISMTLSPVNNYWRTLRRICVSELFTNNRINETMLIRQKCVDDMVSWIGNEVDNKGASSGIDVLHFVFPAMFNILGYHTLSRDLVNPESKIASDFYTAMSGFEECSRPNISDIFPYLSWLDLQGFRRKTDRDLGKVLEIISGFVNERVKQRQGRPLEQSIDVLDVALNFVSSRKDEPAKLSHIEITSFILEMFVGGTETTSGSTEWAMTELLRNPEKMMKVKAELARVVGANKKFEESDVDNLPYLQATVEETLRLHPPLPFLVPRKAVCDTNFMGYFIPKDTKVLINVSSIGRDEESWEDPLSFKPERFLNSKIKYRGQDFEYLPFGAGRRMCPGVLLGHRALPLLLGSLLHNFDWKLCEGETSTTIDMTETLGTTAKKLHHLKAIPKRMSSTNWA